MQEKVLPNCTASPNSKEIKLGSRVQEAFLSTVKNTGVVLVPHRAWKCAPIAISVGVDVFDVSAY